jgi:hypothetical protein
MKKLLFLVFPFCLFGSVCAQKNHLALIHDFEGNNFDYAVKGMVGVNDSLYVIASTPDLRGMFFRIDENGDGYEVIWKFEEDYWEPNSIVSDDKAIYITTRIGSDGALFKYSLEDYSFKRVRDFWNSGVQEPNIKYVTDTALWYTSLWSREDEGSVFSTGLDGTDLKKLYSAKDPQEASMPSNFFFHNDKVYISFWGGGNYLDSYCGSLARMNTDGSGYETIVKGDGDIGTQPQSIIIRDDKLIGLFAYSAYAFEGRVFRCNLDGSEFESLGSVEHRSLTRLLETQSLFYGITTYAIYGINPYNGNIKIYDQFSDNPDFGWDVVSDPVNLNGNVFIATQQGGPNGGGTILKWLNARPEVQVREKTDGRMASEGEVALEQLFVDPNEDELVSRYHYDPALISINMYKGILKLNPLTSDPFEIRITATDGWAGHAGAIVKFNPFEVVEFSPDEAQMEGGATIADNEVVTGIIVTTPESKSFVFPNPAASVLKLSVANAESIQFSKPDGSIYRLFRSPGQELDISSFANGFYIVRVNVGGKSYWQKLLKE